MHIEIIVKPNEWKEADELRKKLRKLKVPAPIIIIQKG
jgi:hypothetical protein